MFNITKGEKNKYSYEFKGFYPQILDEEPNIYDYKLEQIYNNKNIKNIAITGIYGAGKSSVWKTYKNRQERLNRDQWGEGAVITVSLADFKEISKTTNENSTISHLNHVEKQIINQILYQIDSEKIPLSKYDLKLPKTTSGRNKQIVALIFFIVGIWSIFAQDDIKKILDLFYLNLSMLSSILPLILMGFPAYFFFVWVLPKLKFRITKINIKGTEAKKVEDTEGILDKSMHEVVYLILSSTAHTIVFEDLDRYNDIGLFIKLRELNFLVNKQSNETVRFVYMVKDSMFESKDRTKFFDIIIPIVPVINSENSKGKLLESFEDVDDEDKRPSTDTLERLSLYIDDMRILSAIRNEYEIYYYRISPKKRGLDINKLFGLIVLKNIFPIEFDNLQLDRGYIYDLFKQKGYYKEKLLIHIDHEINELRDKLNYLKQTIATRKTDIMAIYIPVNFFVNLNITLPVKDFLFEWSKEPLKVYNIKFGNRSGNRTFEQVYNEMLKNEEYKKAVENIKLDDINKEINATIGHIKSKKNEKEIVNLMPLSKILNRFEYEQLSEFFYIEEYDKLLRNHYFPLIRFLILAGLIDESYKYYKGSFIESSLDISDEEYLMKLGIGEMIIPEFKLSNPDIIIRKLNENDFNRESIFNYSLFNEMIRGKHKTKIQNATKTILRKVNIDRFCRYLNLLDDDILNEFVILQLPERLDNLLFITEQNDMHTELNNRVISMVYCNYREEYNNLPKKNDLVKYTENNSEILEIERVQENNDFVSGLIEAEVKFTDLTKLNFSNYLSEQIANNCLYSVTYKNTKKLVDSITNRNQLKNTEKYLSIIQNEEIFSEIDKAIKGNYENILKEYLEMAKESNINLYNDEETVLFVLKSDIDLELKKKFLLRNITKIETIEDIEDFELWHVALKHNRVEYNESNLNNLVENDVVDNLIISYLNEYYNNKKPKIVSEELADRLINNSKIKDVVFVDLLNYTKNSIYLLSEDLTPFRVNKLIAEDMVGINKENMIRIMSRANTELICFIENDIEKASSLIVEEPVLGNITKDVVIMLFNSNIFTEGIFLSIIETLDFEYSLFDLQNSSFQLQTEVLHKAWDKSDIDRIISEPDNFWLWDKFANIVEQEDIKETILKKDLSVKFVDKIIGTDNISDGFKTEIIVKKIIGKKLLFKIPIWLNKVKGLKELGTVFDSKRPIIETRNEEMIARALEKLNIISISADRSINFRPKTMRRLLNSGNKE